MTFYIRQFFIVSALVVVFFNLSSAQSSKSHFSLKVIDHQTENSIQGSEVTLFIKYPNEMSIITGVTDSLGYFSFLVRDSVISCFCSVSVQGYSSLEYQQLDLSVDPIILRLNQNVTKLSEITVLGKQDSIQVKKDRISYEAESILSNTDKNLEGLLMRIPGVEIVDGIFYLDGVQLRNIQIDGEAYTGKESRSAFKNIPTDIIYRLEVIDIISPFNNAKVSHAINVITKNPAVTLFGKIVGGYGTNDRYRAAANIYYKNDRIKLVALGDANNINSEDLLSSQLPSLFTGDNQIRASGIYFTYYSKKNTIISLNTLYNDISRRDKTVFFQENINSNSLFISENTKNAFDQISDFEFSLSNSGIISSFNANINYFTEDNTAITVSDEYSLNQDMLIYDFNSFDSISGQSKNLITDINYTRALGKTNRWSLTSGISYFGSITDDENQLAYYLDGNSTSRENSGQKIKNNPSLSFEISRNVKKLKSFFRLSSGYDQIESKSKASISSDSISYSIKDIENYGVNFKSEYFVNKVVFGLNRSHNENWSYGINLSYLDYSLNNNDYNRENIFSDVNNKVLPEIYIVNRVDAQKNYSISYDLSEQVPEIEKLSPFFRNPTSTRSTIGNPNLKLGFKHSFKVRLKSSSNTSWQNYLDYGFIRIENFIGQSLIIPTTDTSIQEILIPSGTQLYSFQNFAKQTTHGIRVKHANATKKHRYHVRYGANYDLTPGTFNTSYFNNTIKSAMMSISEIYTPNKQVSVYINGGTSFVNITTDLNNEVENNLLNWNFNTLIKTLIYKRLLITLESNSYQVVNVGMNTASDVVNTISASLNISLMKEQQGSLELSVFDLLNQNRDITNTPNLNFITQENRLMLTRYFAVEFAIKL